jgi:hypothetical protein
MICASPTTGRVPVPNRRQLLAARAGSILAARFDRNAGPSFTGLVWKLVLLAGFAVVLTAGADHALVTLLRLLQALYCFGAALAAALAILHRQKLVTAGFSYWHETAVFVATALLSHLALRALG